MLKLALTSLGAALLVAATLLTGLRAAPAAGRPFAPAPGQAADRTPASLEPHALADARADEPPRNEERLDAFLDRQARRLRDLSAASDRPSTAGARLTPAMVANLAARCAPATPTSALLSIAKVESDLSPLTIGVNGPRRRVVHPPSQAEAAATASALIAAGENVDLGLAQINSRNLGPLGLRIEDAFDPCRNLAGAARILDRAYADALRRGQANRPILQVAYSIYNSGDPERGFANGYAGRTVAAHRAMGR